MVSGEPGSKHIISVIDCEQAGWYPEYWEYSKLLYGVEYTHPWRSEGWTDKVMTPFVDAFFAYSDYSLWRGVL